MGMAPAPKDRAKGREAAPAQPGPGLMASPDAVNAARRLKKTHVVDTTPEHLRALRRVLKAIYWETHKQQLDLLRMCCPSDWQYDTVRNESLRLINEGEKVLVQSVLTMVSGQDSGEGEGR